MFPGFVYSLFSVFLMLWEGGWECSLAITLDDRKYFQSIVPYEYIPLPPLLGLLDGPKKCFALVFTVVGAFWSLVFSRCPSRWATLHFAADTPSMIS